MKSAKFLAMMTAAAMSISTMSSCDDDNEKEDKPVNHAAAVAGNYDGYALAGCAFFRNMLSMEQSVSIAADDDLNEADVTYISQTWGTFFFDDATVAFADGVYSLTGEGTATMPSHQGSGTTEYAAVLSATIDADGTAQFLFQVPGVMNGLNITVANDKAPLAYGVAKTYKGYTSASSQYFQAMTADNETVVLTAKETDLTMVSVLFTSETWGTFSSDNVTVSYADGIFSLEGSGTCSMGMSAENVREYNMQFSGTVSADGTSTFTFSVPAVMGGLTINFTEGETSEAE